MKRLLIALSALALVGCSHNPAVFAFGKLARIGNVEYGEISYINGIYILDVSRENSSWEMEIDDEDGIQYDTSTGTIKGVKRITRRIGDQCTGYLKDLTKVSPEVAQTWVERTKPLPDEPEKKKGEGNQNLNAVVPEAKKEDK